MCVKKIFVNGFRNIKHAVIDLKDKINVFYGLNAQGKTNLIEAIYLCAMGRSVRTNIESELINFDELNASIKINFSESYDNNLESININLYRDQKKDIYINNNKINKLGELFGKFPVVIFSPEDLKLIKANPSVRRKFMDTEICQVNKIYYYELKQYYKALRHRNAFLKNISSNIFNKLSDSEKQMFDVWDTELINHGVKIINKRQEFIYKINKYAGDIYSHITNHKEKLNIIYKPNVTQENFDKKLKSHRDYDIYLKSTSSGIHKDDLLFEINNKQAKTFGSQGQQKTIALALKLAEINLIYNTIKRHPVLLLDDILSELDESRRNFLIDYIKDLQVLLTSSDSKDLLKKIFVNAKFFLVDSGIFFSE